MVSWPALSKSLEAAIDGQMGENVRLIPYRTAGGGFAAPQIDPTRSVVDAVGYIIGRGTFLAGQGIMQQKRADADLLLAIQNKYLTNIRQFDKVILLDRSLTITYSISYVEESPHGRQKLHLLLDKGST